MSDYKMVPVVATDEMIEAGNCAVHEGALDAYHAMLSAAPPFVVTDEVAMKALRTFSQIRWQAESLIGHSRDAEIVAMRAAIEAVLGGGV